MPDQDPAASTGSKSIFQSKTMIVNTAIPAALAITALVSPHAADQVKTYVAANLEGVIALWGAINIALRWLTKGRVSLFGSDS